MGAYGGRLAGFMKERDHVHRFVLEKGSAYSILSLGGFLRDLQNET